MRLSPTPAPRLGVGAAIATLMLSSCDSFPFTAQIGARRTDAGGIEILFASCPGERVRRVALEMSDPAHARTERVLWAIEAADGAVGGDSTLVFVVGTTPDDFVDVIPFDLAPKPTDPRIAVVTTTTHGEVLLDFSTSDLGEGEVVVNGSSHPISTERFDKSVAAACGS